MTMQAYGTLLTANADERTLTYRLLPYGEEGRTNLGKITASKGSVTIPENAGDVTLNLEHDFKRPVGRAVHIDEDAAGLTATFKVAATTAGNDLLAEAADGLRPAVSVELDNPVIRAGRLVAGLLTGAGAVVRPAFPSAQLVAEDAGELPEDTDDDTTDALATDEDNTEEEATVAEDNQIVATQASAPVGLRATAVKVNENRDKSANELFAALANAHATGDRQMLAALDQTVQADAISAQQPQWAGEIWNSRTHRQKFVPLFNRQALTGLKITGWKFAARTGTPPQPPATPTVASYSGFPAEPNSTEVKTEAVTINAQRLAGANAVDRAFVDFSTPEFWAGYYREAANDLSRKQDASALAHMLTSANYTEVEGGTVPTGVPIALAYTVDGVLAIQDIATPDFAIVGVDLYRELALTRHQDAVAYLSVAVGLDPSEGALNNFKIVPSADPALAGKVLVGASEAHQWYGEKTVRVDTVNIATGGVETGVFSYHAVNTGSADAFALVAEGA
ncbi:hypothetical protein [Cellulosimicrobium marinum]|uniref:hypothetical protein n=1 Tax=Cellulosimicrobium marinum TaxID=1638992 RepID=UPI001E4FE420|nr:hypothetical protein [Cellulosimicrobium marinum]MCB7135356.1 hypothetical protein [Cellulosimicrobium marinum]